MGGARNPMLGGMGGGGGAGGNANMMFGKFLGIKIYEDESHIFWRLI